MTDPPLARFGTTRPVERAAHHRTSARPGTRKSSIPADFGDYDTDGANQRRHRCDKAPRLDVMVLFGREEQRTAARLVLQPCV